jgi:hypothetical protein
MCRRPKPKQHHFEVPQPPPDPFAATPTAVTVVCPFKGQIDYEPGDIECGLLQVPENR